MIPGFTSKTAVVNNAEPYLRAQLMHRTLDGATENDAFLPYAPSTLRAIFAHGATDLGLLIGSRRTPTNVNTAMFWWLRFSFLLQRLT